MATTYTVPQTEAEWREAYALTPEREAPFTTLSGVPVKPLYTAADLPDAKDIGVPGGYPFTRGVYPSMQSSENIVAINKDSNAPIFEFSDLGIVGDLNKIVPKLTEAVKARKGG